MFNAFDPERVNLRAAAALGGVLVVVVAGLALLAVGLAGLLAWAAS